MPQGNVRNRAPLFLQLLILLITWANGTSILELCHDPLGMESVAIPDTSLSASSTFNINLGPENARLRNEVGEGAWCPAAMIQKGVEEWLQIDLGKPHRFTGVATQGRFGNGKGQEYAESYLIQYWSDAKWIQYVNRTGSSIFDGNQNTYMVSFTGLNPPILSQRIRILPYSVHPRTVCMRIELYGCPYTGGVARYRYSNGGVNRSELLQEQREDLQQHKLINGVLGLDPTFNFSNAFDWISWHRNQSPVFLEFFFDEFRSFHSVSFHVWEDIKAGIQSVSKLEVSFAKPTDALDNDVTWGNSIITERDPIVSSTTPCIRNVTVTLGGFVTWAVKFAIHIKGTFLYLTEVEFASTPVNGTEETNSASGSEESLDPRYVAFLSPDLEESGVAVQQGSPTDAALLVSGLIAFSLLILGVTVSLVFWKRRSLPKPVWLRGQGPLDFSPVICPGGKGYLRKVDQDGTDSQRLSRPFSLPDGTSTLPRGSSLGSLLMDGPLGLHHPHCCHYQTSYVSQPSQMGPPPPSQTVLGYSAMCSRSSRDITLSSPESYQEAYSVEYASPLLSRATPASGKQPVSRENGNNASETNPRTRLPLGQRRSLSSTFKPTAKSHEDQAYASTDILKMSDSTRPLSSHGRPNFAHTHQQLYFLTQDSAGGPLGLSPVFPSPKPSKSLACIPERC